MYNQFLQGIFVKRFPAAGENSSGSSIPSLVLMEISIFRFSNRLSRNRSRASRSPRNRSLLDTTVGRGTAQIQIYFLVAELTEFSAITNEILRSVGQDLGEPHTFPSLCSAEYHFLLEFRVLSCLGAIKGVKIFIHGMKTAVIGASVYVACDPSMEQSRNS